MMGVYEVIKYLIVVQITGSENPNCRRATENMFRKVIKWTSCFFLINAALFGNVDRMSQNKLTCHKMKKKKM
jgi:hypothetical protein